MPILLTGSPRTGSTWVGRVLATAPSTRYVHEPFNISAPSCSCGYKHDYWYSYISKDNEAAAYKHFMHTFGFQFNRYSFKNSIKTAWNAKRLRTITAYIGSLFAQRSVIKAPHSIFSAQWLDSVFDLDIVVLIRHPAAFVNSYKRLNWSHPWSHFLDQPQLIREHLSPFEKEIRDYEANEHDLIDQAALLWKLIHYMILKYRGSHPDWVYLRYEDLSLNPMLGFQKIFDHLNLKFSTKVRKMIEQTIDPQNPVDSENPYSIKRNSHENIWKWKNRLSSQEIERIKNIVADIAGEFYTESDWDSPGKEV